MKRRTGRKLVSMLLAMVMVLALLPAAPARAYFDPEYLVELDYRENGTEYHTTGAEPMKVGNTMVAYPTWQGQYGDVSKHYFDWEVKNGNGSWSKYRAADRPGENTLLLTEELAGKTLRCYIYFDYEYPDQDTEYRSEEFTVIGEITSAEVTVPAPVVGQKAGDSYLVSVPKGQHFTVTNRKHSAGDREGVNWRVTDPKKWLKNDDIFKTGEKYDIVFLLNADKGWRFAKSVRVKVNGVPAMYSWSWDKSWAGEDYDKGWSAQHSFTAEEPKLVPITSVNITVPRPQAGKKMPQTASIPSDAPYLVDHIVWGVGETYIDNINNSDLPGDAVCMDGRNYWACIRVTPKPGYVFQRKSDSSSNPDGLTMTVNGAVINEDELVIQKNGDLTVWAPMRVGAEPKKTPTVYVTVPVPVIGQKAGDTPQATVPDDCHVKVLECKWRPLYNYMKPEEIFKADETYECAITLRAEEGWQISEVSQNARLVLNGKEAGTVEASSSKRMNGFYVEYSVFTKHIPAAEAAQPVTLTFDTNGGSKLEPKTVEKGVSVKLSGYIPVKSGYDFAGWCSDPGLQKPVTKVTLEGDTTVYAKWEKAVPPKFADVKTTDWFFKFVQWAVDRNITAGTSKNPPLFSPNDTCVNCQIITFIWNSQGQPKSNIKNPFTDVKETDWFCQPALWAYENGLVSGNKFNPHQPCTRASTVLYLWRFAGKPSAPLSKFNDVDRSAEYAKAVDWAVANGVTAGNGAGGFSPSEICSRAQIVTFIYNNFEKNK